MYEARRKNITRIFDKVYEEKEKDLDKEETGEEMRKIIKMN
jgi:hypothetical protein